MLTTRSFTSPDDTKDFSGKARLETITIGGVTAARGTYEPGWKWSQDSKPVAGTDSCKATHAGYIVSGRMHVVTDDGNEADAGPGEMMVISPGHDAWVLGDERCVFIDFGSSVNLS